MALEKAATSGWGIAFLVSAGIVYEIIAAACSSPQTTEINAKARAGTLMKWVYIGEVQAAGFVLAAAYFDRKYKNAYITGGLAAGLVMHGCYVHAKRAGIANPGSPTEQYAPNDAGAPYGY
ncbi:MAG: hypothetical protein ACREBW_10280 [Candidatus Micrarchaeaceae archaeon]